jgi:TRAP-type C4-dicarboxylate transport system substrate-binding protein
VASKFFETSKFYALTEHNFSPLSIYFSENTFKRMDAKTRDAFIDAAQKAAADTRAHGMQVEGEAKKILQEKGVAINEVDKEAFRKRVAVQHENFIKQRPESKAFIEQIRGTKV